MEFIPYTLKWLELILRWGHILFAILWVGNSFLFNFLDNKLNKNILKMFHYKKIWCATSTHVGEEVFCGKTHIELKKRLKNVILIIIPRHIHRAKEIVKELKEVNLKICL